MLRLYQRYFCVASALFVPLLTLMGPGWLNISGVGPDWAVLWLLPWALVDGSLSAVIAGLFLGLILDGISVSDISQVPALMVLGFWWGYIGRYGSADERSFLNLAILAWLGSALNGVSLLIQIHLGLNQPSLEVLMSWGLYTLFAQSIVTALLAPLVCLFLLKWWKRRSYF